MYHNLLKNYEKSEEYVENLETWLNQFSKTITDMNRQIKKIDNKKPLNSKEVNEIRRALQTQEKDKTTKSILSKLENGKWKDKTRSLGKDLTKAQINEEVERLLDQ